MLACAVPATGIRVLETPTKHSSGSSGVPSDGELSECASEEVGTGWGAEGGPPDADVVDAPSPQRSRRAAPEHSGCHARATTAAMSLEEDMDCNKKDCEVVDGQQPVVDTYGEGDHQGEEVDASATTDASRGKKKGGVVSFNASHSDYECVAAAAEARGWRVMKNEERAKTCNVHWIDDGSIGDWFRRVEPWMRVNHWPGMNNALARKTRLARNMSRMQRLFPKEYQFLPPTWVLPDDMGDLEKRFGEGAESKTMYIVKPDHLCQGRGIFLTTELAKMKSCAAECRQKDQSAVVQRYIMRPMLIDGLKFDLRLYFLVAGKTAVGGGLDLRCFLFRDGLVRLCTTAYSAPTPETMNEKCMHLTNYAINKHSDDFQANTSADDDGSGSKRSLRWFLRVVEEEHGAKERKKLWTKLMGLCVKTVLTVQPTLEAECSGIFPRDLTGGHMGWRCFEILGVDVMLDAKRKPYLIEVNHLPSFTTDSPLDEDIKRRLLDQTLDLTCGAVSAQDRKTYEHLVRERRQGNGVSAGVSPTLAGQAEAVPLTASDANASDQALDEAPSGHASLLDLPVYKDFDRAFPPPADAAKLGLQCQAILSRVQELFKPVHVVRRRDDTVEPSPAAPKPPLPPKPPGAPGGSSMPRPPALEGSVCGPSRSSQSPSPPPLQQRTAPAFPGAPEPPRRGGEHAAANRGAAGLPPAPDTARKRSRSAPGQGLNRCSLPPIPRLSEGREASPRPAAGASAVAAGAAGAGGPAAVGAGAGGRGRSQPPRLAEGEDRCDGPTPSSRRSLSRKASAPRVFLALKSAQLGF